MAVFSALLVLTWTAARIHYAFGGNWTALFCTGANFPVPPELDAGTQRVAPSGYDGQFYRYVAHDPFLQKGYSRYVDAPQLRYRRALVPLAAWLLSFGHPGGTDAAFIAIEMIFLALGGYWCARLMVRRGLSPLWGALFLAIPATLASFDRMLVDGPLTALFAGFLLYCDEERWTRVWVLAMLAALTRETGLLFGAALAIERLLRRDWRRAAWFAASGIPAAAWYGYVATRLPPDRLTPMLTLPVWGLLRRLFQFEPYPDPPVQLVLRIADFLSVLGLIACVVLAVRWILDRRIGPATLAVGFFAALSLVLGAPVMIEALAFGRPVSPLLLWVALEAVSRGTWFAAAPPFLVSLRVAAVFASPAFAIVKGLLGR